VYFKNHPPSLTILTPDTFPSLDYSNHKLWLSEQSLEQQRTRVRHLISDCQDFLQAPAESALRVAEVSADLSRNAKALHRSFAAEIRNRVNSGERLSSKRRPQNALERRADALVVHPHLAGLCDTKRLLTDLPLAEARWLTLHLDRLANQPIGEPLMRRFDGQRSLFALYKDLEVDLPEIDLRLLWRYLELLQAAHRVRLETRSTITSATAAEPIAPRPSTPRPSTDR